MITFGWLGPPDPTILEGFNAVLLMAGKICSLAPGERASPIWSKDVDFGALYAALKKLMEIPYWRRAWILQELVLSPLVVFLCGHEALPFLSLFIFQKWRTECRQDYLGARSRRPAYFDQGLWREITTMGYDTDPTIGVIVEIRQGIALRNKLGEDRVDRFRMMIAFHKAANAHTCLGARYQATNAKDHVYAFMAIIGCNIVPDYSSAKSVADVYRDWVEVMLLRQHIEYHGGLCTLSFLELAGIGYFRESIPNLPSWVPNFSGSAKANTKDSARVTPDFLWHRPGLRFKRPKSKYIRNNARLYCPSILLDEITYVSPRINNHVENFPVTGWVKWGLNRILRHPYEGLTSQHKIIGIADCIVNKSKRFTDLPLDGIYDPISVDAAFNEERLQLEKIMNMEKSSVKKHNDDLSRREAEDFPRCEVRPLLHILIRAWVQEHPYHDIDWCSMMLAIEDLPSYVFENSGDPEDSFARDWPTAISSASGLCLAETSDGCIGLCPPRVQQGDVVAMLQGCPNPVILRKFGQHYAFVGVSYFSVYMKGTETLNKLLEQGKLKEKIIEIR